MPLHSRKQASACDRPQVHPGVALACTFPGTCAGCSAWQRTAVVVVLLQVRAELRAVGVDALRVGARARKRAAAVQAGHDGVWVRGAHVTALAAAGARQRFNIRDGCQELTRHRDCGPLTKVSEKRTGRYCAPQALAIGKQTLLMPRDTCSLACHTYWACNALVQAYMSRCSTSEQEGMPNKSRCCASSTCC